MSFRNVKNDEVLVFSELPSLLQCVPWPRLFRCEKQFLLVRGRRQDDLMNLRAIESMQ